MNPPSHLSHSQLIPLITSGLPPASRKLQAVLATQRLDCAAVTLDHPQQRIDSFARKYLSTFPPHHGFLRQANRFLEEVLRNAQLFPERTDPARRNAPALLQKLRGRLPVELQVMRRRHQL